MCCFCSTVRQKQKQNPPFLTPLPLLAIAFSLLLFAAKHLNNTFLYLRTLLFLPSLNSVTRHSREAAVVKITKSSTACSFCLIICGLTFETQTYLDPWCLLLIPLTLLSFPLEFCLFIYFHCLFLVLPTRNKALKGRDFQLCNSLMCLQQIKQ